MLDLKFIRENSQTVKEGALKKGVEIDIDQILALDEQRRELQTELDGRKAEKNQFSKTIANLDAEQKKLKIEEFQAKEETTSSLQDDYNRVEQELQNLLENVPNLPDEDVPLGKDETENVVIKEVGKLPEFDFEPKDHLTIGEALDIIDVKRAAKISGARFAYLKGAGAWLEFALIQFTLNTLTDPKIIATIAGESDQKVSDKIFSPIIPPAMIREEAYRKMARLGDDADERYFLPKDDLYLIGSAEHSLGPIFMDETLDIDELPIRYLGFSPSFRREAGSYGRDTRGILRMHQFDKLEMQIFATTEQARAEFEFAAQCQEYLLQKLKLPYRSVFVCTGDMGKPDIRQYDLDTWLPSEQSYRETHTADYMGDYQARRLNTKYRYADGETKLVHMIDATALAIGRTIVAILENYQQADGSVLIPEALKPYLPFEIIEK